MSKRREKQKIEKEKRKRGLIESSPLGESKYALKMRQRRIASSIDNNRRQTEN